MNTLAWAAATALGLAIVRAIWPRRRKVDDVRGVRWREDPETGLRDYYATPWLRGEKGHER